MLRCNIFLNIAGLTNPVKKTLPSVFHLSHVRMVRSIAPSKRKCAMSLRPKALVRQNHRQLMVNQSDVIMVVVRMFQYIQKKFEASPKFKQLVSSTFQDLEFDGSL